MPPEEIPAFVEKLKKTGMIKDIAQSLPILDKVGIENFDKNKEDGRPVSGFVQVDSRRRSSSWLKTYYSQRGRTLNTKVCSLIL